MTADYDIGTELSPLFKIISVLVVLFVLGAGVWRLVL